MVWAVFIWFRSRWWRLEQPLGGSMWVVSTYLQYLRDTRGTDIRAGQHSENMSELPSWGPLTCSIGFCMYQKSQVQFYRGR